jgi:lysozyme family protein
MDFIDAFAKLIGHEGSFQALKNDRGNWTGGAVGAGELKGTKFGISARSYPTLDIEHLTLDQARDIYRRDFWGPAGCDMVPEQIKFPLFDFAVHSGPGRAARLLQRAVGAEEDGSIGPQTVMSILNMPPDKVLRRFDAHRLLHLVEDPTFVAFGKGWCKRLAKNALL